MEGSRMEEKALHEKFMQYRVRNEWFKYSNEIEEFIKNPQLPEPIVYRRIVESNEIDYTLNWESYNHIRNVSMEEFDSNEWNYIFN